MSKRKEDTHNSYYPPEIVQDEVEHSLAFYHIYKGVLKELQEHGMLPEEGDCFIGGCGYGGDLRAFNEIDDDKKLRFRAVSLGNTPTEEVREELGDRLDFEETDIISALKEDARSGRKYRLVGFFNVCGDQMCDPEIVRGIEGVTRRHSIVLEGGVAPTPLPRGEMEKNFEKTWVPEEAEREWFQRWIRKDNTQDYM